MRQKPHVLNLIGPIMGIVSLGLASGYYLWYDSLKNKTIVTDGLTNWIILVISISFSLVVAIIVNHRSRLSEYEVNTALDKITKMVKSDYDLRIERKNNVAEYLERTLHVLEKHVKTTISQMEEWNNISERKEKEIVEENCQEQWKGQAQLSKKKLEKIIDTSIDVINTKMSNHLELLIHCIDSRLDFDYEKNDYYLDDLETAEFLIEDLFVEVNKIHKDNPDSFLNNFACDDKTVKMEDGSLQTIHTVEIIPEKQVPIKQSRKELLQEYEKDYLKRIFEDEN